MRQVEMGVVFACALALPFVLVAGARATDGQADKPAGGLSGPWFTPPAAASLAYEPAFCRCTQWFCYNIPSGERECVCMQLRCDGPITPSPN